MKTLDLIITAIFALAMIILAWLGTCYLDFWMLAIGAVVILIFTILMQIQKNRMQED